MNAIILHCKPGSRFHFGKYAPDRDSDTALADTDEIIHSDTLFAALANNWSDSAGNADELVALFNSGRVNISSGFHCLEAGGVFTYFLPRPVSFNLFDPEGGTDIKKFRKINYISSGIWQRLITPGSLPVLEDIVIIDKRFALCSDELPCLQSLPANERALLSAQLSICSTVTLPKVEVRNNEPDSRIYQLSVTEIADNTKFIPELRVHYYFLLEAAQDIAPALKQKLDLSIALLQYNGVGAERSTIGHFEDITTIPGWNINIGQPHSSLCCSIGLVNPLETQTAWLGKSIVRGGRRLGSEGRRWLHSVRMLMEGAIISSTEKGRLVSVSPEESAGPFLRNGIAFTLPVHQNWIP